MDAAVRVTASGLQGDEQADRRHHGGPDQALYAYADVDADHWAAALGRDVPPGSLGENLRLSGLDVSGARIGERWRIGRAVVVEVTGPRMPCRTLAGFWDIPDFVARFNSAGRPGAYLRVIEEGSVRAGETVRVVTRPVHEITVADVLRVRTTGEDPTALLAARETLNASIRDWLDEVASR